MTDSSPRYRYWGDRKPVALDRPAQTVQMAAGTARKTAQIRLYGPIDSWGAPFGVAASEVADALDQVGTDTAVEMHVHSPGGDAFEGLAIMNLLRQHGGPVDIIVDGLAASAASIVAMGATTVTMVPGSQMMIHDASALAIGQADDMREAATMLDSISSNAADQYATKAGKPAAEMRAAMKATTWFKAQEAVDAGLADAVLAPDTEQAQAAQTAAASLAFDLSIYPNAPTARCECGPHGTDISADARMQHKDECPTHSKTPAEPPVNPPTETKEDAIMADTLRKDLCARLGLPEDADDAAISAKLDADAQAHEKAIEDLEAKVEAKPTAQIPDGKKLVDAAQWDDVVAQAALGAKANARQSAEDRDDAVDALVSDGKISRNAENIAKLKADWDADVAAHGNADMTRQRFADMAVLYPVGQPIGHQGDGDTSNEVMTDDEAAVLASLSGTTKEALING